MGATVQGSTLPNPPPTPPESQQPPPTGPGAEPTLDVRIGQPNGPVAEVTLGPQADPLLKVTLGPHNDPAPGQQPDGKPQTTANGDDPGTLWAGFPEKTPNGNAHGWWRKHQGRGLDLPILTQPSPGGQTVNNDEADREANRRGDSRDRQWNENQGANRTNLRRGVIRDYLQQNLQNTILESRVGINGRGGLQQLVQTAADGLSRTLNGSLVVTDKVLKTIEREITNLLRADSYHNNARPGTIPYDRAIQISQLLLRHIPNDLSKQFQDVTPQKMLDGMILLQLWAGPGGCLDDVQRITNCKPSILPEGMVWANFRDTGLLVAMLLKNAASLNDRSSLDVAVQRFVKLLVAKGELGVLLAAIQLTAEARSGRMSLSRVAALVQVYELIGQLVRNAERAMKEAAPPKPTELARTERGLAFSAALESNEAEAALRQYLAFNPAAKADSGASAFFSEQLAETSARIAVDSSQKEIVDWLGSGRHRFVTEVDLGKPIGIVIDRLSDVCFTASQIRVVLVRDGSVLGWHILRSSLVG